MTANDLLREAQASQRLEQTDPHFCATFRTLGAVLREAQGSGVQIPGAVYRGLVVAAWRVATRTPA